MSTAADRLVSVIADLKTVEEGAVALIDSQSSQIRALAAAVADGQAISSGDLNAWADSLEALKAPLAAAVAANTAAAPLPADTLEAGAGDDTLLGGQGDDTIVTGAGDDSIAPTAGAGLPDDHIVEGGNDSLPAEAGNDTITE